MKKIAVLIVILIIGGVVMGEPDFFSFTGGIPLANGRMKAPGDENYCYNPEEILLEIKGLSEKVLIAETTPITPTKDLVFYKAIHKKNNFIYLACTDLVVEEDTKNFVIKLDTRTKECTQTLITSDKPAKTYEIVKTDTGFDFLPKYLPELNWPDSDLNIAFVVDMPTGEVTVTKGASNEHITIPTGVYSDYSEIQALINKPNVGGVSRAWGSESLENTYADPYFNKFVSITDDGLINKGKNSVVRVSKYVNNNWEFVEDVDASLGTLTLQASEDQWVTFDFIGTGESQSMCGPVFMANGETITFNWVATATLNVTYKCKEFEAISPAYIPDSISYNFENEEVTVSEGTVTADVDKSGDVPVVYDTLGSMKYYSVQYSNGPLTLVGDFGTGIESYDDLVSCLTQPDNYPYYKMFLYGFDITNYTDYNDKDHHYETEELYLKVLKSFYQLSENEVYFFDRRTFIMHELTTDTAFDMGAEHDLSGVTSQVFCHFEDTLLALNDENICFFKDTKMSVISAHEALFLHGHIEDFLIKRKGDVFYLYFLSVNSNVSYVYKASRNKIEYAMIETPVGEDFAITGVDNNYVYGINYDEEGTAFFVRRKVNYTNHTISEQKTTISDNDNIFYEYTVNETSIDTDSGR